MCFWLLLSFFILQISISLSRKIEIGILLILFLVVNNAIAAVRYVDITGIYIDMPAASGVASDYYNFDSTGNKETLKFGIDTNGKLGGIYAKENFSAVKIEVYAPTKLASILIVGTIDGSRLMLKVGNRTAQSGLIIAATATASLSEIFSLPELSITQGIIIEATGVLKAGGNKNESEDSAGGVAALKIEKQPIITDITNNGIIEGGYSAISVVGPLNLIKGTITNNGIIKGGKYSLLSSLASTQTKGLERTFKLENNKQIIGTLKLSGNNCQITNNGVIGKKISDDSEIETSIVLQHATVTIKNNKELFLSSIENKETPKSYLKIISSGTIDIKKNAYITVLENTNLFKVKKTLVLSQPSINQGSIIAETLSSAATLTNEGDILVEHLKGGIIDNKSKSNFTIAKNSYDNVVILGELKLTDFLTQLGTLSVTTINATNSTLINKGSININDEIKIKIIENQAYFVANKVEMKQQTMVTEGSPTQITRALITCGSITNTIKGTIKINDIKNAHITNDGTLIITHHTAGTITIIGKLNIDTLQQNAALQADEIIGKTLINQAAATITGMTKLQHLNNQQKLHARGDFILTSTSTNTSDLSVESLISSGTLSNEPSGIIICDRIKNSKIINLGILNVKRYIEGKVNIEGTLTSIENLINIATLKVDNLIAKQEFTNRASVTISNNAKMVKINNDSYFSVSGTLSFSDESSVNNDRLDVNNLVNSKNLTNGAQGKIIINVLKDTKITNNSSLPLGLLVKKYIYGEVTVTGWLNLADNLIQKGNLQAENIESKNLINENKIRVSNNVKFTNLINQATATIIVGRQFFLNGYATNTGKIKTNVFDNKGIFDNKENAVLDITSRSNDVILDNKHYKNSGTLKANTILIPGSFTNNGVLVTENLKNNGIISTIYTAAATSKITIGKSIKGDFVINQPVEFSGNVKIEGDLYIKSLSIKSYQKSQQNNLIMAEQFTLTVEGKATLSKLTNNGSITVNGRLTLQNESINNKYLYANEVQCEKTLTNKANAIAIFNTIKKSNIDNTAANAVLQVSEIIDGGATGESVNILGNLELIASITQGGKLQVTNIKGEEAGLNVSKTGDITTNNIEIKNINNNGNILINKNLILTAVSTNTGKITANIFNCGAKFYNEKTATVTCTDLHKATNIINAQDATFEVLKTISGNSTISGNLNIGSNVILSSDISLNVDRITSSQDACFTIDERAILNIKEAFKEDNINIINNRGTLKIKSGIEFKSYKGENAQIYLKIPTDLQSLNNNKKPLIHVVESFDCNILADKPAIIIYTDKPPANEELHKDVEVTLIQAKALKIQKNSQEASITNFIASEKIKTSSILLFLDNIGITENQDVIIARIKWLEAKKIVNVTDKAISVTKLAEVMQQFTKEQSKKALLVQLDSEIQQSKLRPETKDLLDYLLSNHENQQEVAQHLKEIKAMFFVNVDEFAKNPVKLLDHLNEYNDYKEYQASKPISPLIHPKFYEMVEEIIVDNSDISNIVNSENIKSFFAGISDRLVANRVNAKINELHQGLNLTVSKNNAYTWSSFCMNKTKDKKRFGYMINDWSSNIAYIGIDRSFDYFQLGWMFGYANTKVKSLGTGLTKTTRNNSYDFKDITTAIYCNYKQKVTSVTCALLFGQSTQNESHQLKNKKLAASCSANLLAIMGEFTYTYYINNLNFDLGSKFEFHHIIIPTHHLQTEIKLALPTIKANVKRKSISNRINLGVKASATYQLPISPVIAAQAALSLAYMHNIDLNKDRIQEMEFFKKLFYIEKNSHCKHGVHLDLSLQVDIYKSVNLIFGLNAAYKDYSYSMGGKTSLHYYF